MLRLDEIAQAKPRCRENFRLERLLDNFAAHLYPPEEHPAWDVLQQMGNTGETFPFAIG